MMWYVGYLTGWAAVWLAAWVIGVQTDGWPGWVVGVLAVVVGWKLGSDLKRWHGGQKTRGIPVVGEEALARPHVLGIGTVVVMRKGKYVLGANWLVCRGQRLDPEAYPELASAWPVIGGKLVIPHAPRDTDFEAVVKVR